ncbi:MAG: hypothetical protein TREMPRED_002824 [Tremellales sp. Tagirdzhanova-0007]|nr:MAG: hypothetical protein TREMPRED_002824 [Tremellales sp. Tagirdzhanova-0007]
MGLGATLRARSTTVAAWKLPREDSCIAPDDVWSNKDMDPSPPEYRRWTTWTFFTYWASDLLNPGTWAVVSSFITLGLTWWESCLALLVGGFLVAIVITANGIVGAKVHTPFAITSRSVFGYWGSKFVVFSRMVIACFWLSINSWSGGVFVTLMIQAIWPQYANLKNGVPKSQGATSADFLSFFLFWLLQLPFVFIHPSKLAWMFNVKVVLVPIVAIGMLIWASSSILSMSIALTLSTPGAPRFMAFMYSITACMGTWATLSLNIGDFSRYCKKPSSGYIQLLALPLLNASVAIFAAISGACLLPIYGADTKIQLYQPYDIVGLWNTNGGGRAAMFLASLVWALANVTTNVTANSISAANDMTSLAPKYINIKRGQIIAVTVGVFGFAPWKVLATAGNFLTFMASYSIVLAPIAAIMAVDFFVVKRQKLDIYELYRPDGIYRFSKGWNWRAYIALACGIAPNMPGMINAINSSVSIGNIKYLYMVSNIVGDFIAIVVYLTLCAIFPAYDSLVEQAVHDYVDNQFADYGAYSGGGDMEEKKGQDEIFGSRNEDVPVVSQLVDSRRFPG